MKRLRLGDFLAALCLLAGAGMAVAGNAPCVLRQEALPDPVIEAGARDESRATLLAVDPPGENRVTANTIVKIDVEYHVANFQPRKHELSAQFATLGAGSSGAPISEDRNYLESATGRVRLCVPLRFFYEHGSMRWPLTFQVYLHEIHRRRSDVIAKSATHILRSSDTPPDALALQARMPSPAYQIALLPVFAFFETQAATRETCGTRFTELAPEVESRYGAWLAPNAAFSEQVSKEQLELYELISKHGNSHAETSHGHTRESVKEKYRLMPDFEARRNCEEFIRSLGTARLDPEVRLAEQLEVLRDPKEKNPSDAI